PDQSARHTEGGEQPREHRPGVDHLVTGRLQRFGSDLPQPVAGYVAGRGGREPGRPVLARSDEPGVERCCGGHGRSRSPAQARPRAVSTMKARETRAMSTVMTVSAKSIEPPGITGSSGLTPSPAARRSSFRPRKRTVPAYS